MKNTKILAYSLAVLTLMINFNYALAKGSDSGGSGSTNSSDSGLEAEVEHGVTTQVPHGGDESKGTVTLALSGDNSGTETETEHGVTFLKPQNEDKALEERLKGRILLQVESKGEAWWIDPTTNAKILLGRPDDAFRIMRESGLGISNSDLNKILSSDDSAMSNSALAKKLSGRILLQVEDKGKAWYVNPLDLKRYYLGRPADAFSVMRSLGLGIKNDDLDKIKELASANDNKKMTVVLGTLNNSGESGTAELTEENGKVKVEIRLTGAPAGISQPSHIHMGSTPTFGDVKYPLNNVVDGRSETILNVTMEALLAQRPLAINVHKSAAEIGVYVVGGNL
jgi:hypothetical protein